MDILEQLGKDVLLLLMDNRRLNLAFIDPENRIKAIGVDVQLEDLQDRDIYMVLDTSAWAQLGAMGDVIKSMDIPLIVDHHQGEDDLGATFFKDTTAEAAGKLFKVDAADALGVTWTSRMARPLFAAVATDTGWYRFGSAGAGTYQLAARLIEAGASPAWKFTGNFMSKRHSDVCDYAEWFSSESVSS